MKRKGNLYSKICSMENLILAEKKARRGKGYQDGVKLHDKNRKQNLINLQTSLVNGTYETSEYSTFKIFEPKERLIYSLPFYPDRITHHAIMNVLEPIFVSTFTADTYSCIKKRGIHGALRSLTKSLTYQDRTMYAVKLDIKKFYPSIDHSILKGLLRRKIKDNQLLYLLDGIIDSCAGVPIGNYLSQYFANFYLTYFDHWIKETMGVKDYFRYADDIVILSPDKAHLHKLFHQIETYLMDRLKLTVKSNWQIFPVSARGIDFVGYVSFHTHIRLRPKIKHRFARMLKKRKNRASIASYKGWTKHGNCRNLEKKLLHEKL